MTKKACSMFQLEHRWCAVVLEVRGRNVVGFETLAGDDLHEVASMLGECPLTVSFSDRGCYLAYLSFPFGGKRKIGMVIREELDDYFPFSLEDVCFDFQEIGKGNVLVAAIPKSNLETLRLDRKINLITLNSISALYALRWFNIIVERNFVFVSIDGETASIIAFLDGQLNTVRQIVFSGQIPILRDAIGESSNLGGLEAEVCYMVCSDEDTNTVQELASSVTNMRMVSPSPNDYIERHGVGASCHWAGIGAALLALHAKDEINIIADRQVGLPTIENMTLCIGSTVVAVSLIVAGMLYLDVHLKDKVQRSLNFEQVNVFRSVFPKSPPVKDVLKVFEERVKSIERDLSGSAMASNASPLQLLTDISTKIDRQIDVKLSEFSIEGNEFVFAGTTVSFSSVEKITKLLEEVNGVKNTEIQNVDLTANQIKFKIRGKL